jgi:hypothetical protein
MTSSLGEKAKQSNVIQFGGGRAAGKSEAQRVADMWRDREKGVEAQTCFHLWHRAHDGQKTGVCPGCGYDPALYTAHRPSTPTSP